MTPHYAKKPSKYFPIFHSETLNVNQISKLSNNKLIRNHKAYQALEDILSVEHPLFPLQQMRLDQDWMSDCTAYHAGLHTCPNNSGKMCMLPRGAGQQTTTSLCPKKTKFDIHKLKTHEGFLHSFLLQHSHCSSFDSFLCRTWPCLLDLLLVSRQFSIELLNLLLNIITPFTNLETIHIGKLKN